MLKIPQNSFVFGVILISQVCAAMAAGRFDGLGGFEERSRHKRESQYYPSGYEDKERLRDRSAEVDLADRMSALALERRKAFREAGGVPTPAYLPSSPATLLKLSPVVYNQGNLQTCVIFSVVEQLQYVHRSLFNNTFTLLSQPYLIVKAARKLGNCDNIGKHIWFVMDIARDVGTTRLSFFDNKSYNQRASGENICVPLPFGSELQYKYAFEYTKGLFREDRNACIEGKACFSSKAVSIKGALEFGMPVTVSVPVIENSGWRSGVVSVSPKGPSLPLHRYEWHAITVCGYNPITKSFDFKTSWGDKWGKGGYGTVTADYISRFASEAWLGWGAKIIAPQPSVPAPAALSVRKAAMPTAGLQRPRVVMRYDRDNLQDFLDYLFVDYSDETIAEYTPVGKSTVYRLRTDREYAADSDYADVWKALKANFGSEYLKWRKTVIS